MKPVQANLQDVQQILANRIAEVEHNLAVELAAKKAIIEYAESLEKENEELKNLSKEAVGKAEKALESSGEVLSKESKKNL